MILSIGEILYDMFPEGRRLGGAPFNFAYHLKKLGYSVLVAESGKKALEIYERDPEAIDLVILDMIMPDMSGGETYDRLKAINPAIRTLLSSGYSISGKAQAIINSGCQGFIQKPFNLTELSQKVRLILEMFKVLKKISFQFKIVIITL